MKKTAGVALLLALVAGGARAQLQGSDVLFEVMQGLVSGLGIAPANLTYVGGGSGHAPIAMQAEVNSQEIGPMSRFFNATECASSSRVPAVTGCYLIAKEVIANLAGATTACDALAWDQALEAQDLNGIPGIQGPSSTMFEDWRTVMRILYGGRVDAGTGAAQDCNSDLRHTLVSQWGNLFKDGCDTGACTQGLTHVYRGDDVSRSTETFLNLLQLPSVYSPSPTASPFCNGLDNQDNDPIRRACRGTGFGGAGDQICGLASTSSADPRNNTLGLVLPVLIPQQNPYGLSSASPAMATQNCGPSVLGGALFADVAWSLQDVQRYGSRCPNGVYSYGGTCKWPKRVGTAVSEGFGCLAVRGDKPPGSPAAFDGRVYNLWLRAGNGAVLSYQRNTQQLRANVSYYRNHQLAGCREPSATQQIPCFVSNDPCSMGFADFAALQAATPGVKQLAIRSVDAPFESITPPPLDDPDRIAKLARYGLNRNLWMCTYDAFANTGAQPASFVAAQQTIWNAVESGAPAVNESVAAAGLYTLPSPLSFVACP